jgi:hypothetical protein
MANMENLMTEAGKRPADAHASRDTAPYTHFVRHAAVIEDVAIRAED